MRYCRRPPCALNTQLAAAAGARAGAAVLGGQHGREVELVVAVLLQTHTVISDTSSASKSSIRRFVITEKAPTRGYAKQA